MRWLNLKGRLAAIDPNGDAHDGPLRQHRRVKELNRAAGRPEKRTSETKSAGCLCLPFAVGTGRAAACLERPIIRVCVRLLLLRAGSVSPGENRLWFQLQTGTDGAARISGTTGRTHPGCRPQLCASNP